MSHLVTMSTFPCLNVRCTALQVFSQRAKLGLPGRKLSFRRREASFQDVSFQERRAFFVEKSGGNLRSFGRKLRASKGNESESLGVVDDDSRPFRESNFNGVFLLLLLNICVFVADHVLNLPIMRNLYLYHMNPRWYQFLTATFCHASWSHLSGNLFFVYIFGKLVEELEGTFGVLATYIVTGVGANLFSWLLLPSSTVSVGASGAVFGLFAVSVLVRLSWNWRKLLEVVILGQFVVEKVVSEAQMSVSVGSRAISSNAVNHIAHLGGAMVGALLIWLLTRVPLPEDPNDKSV